MDGLRTADISMARYIQRELEYFLKYFVFGENIG